MNGKVTYIRIGEHLTWYGHGKSKLERTACVQRDDKHGKDKCRVHHKVSSASILRMAKIQEKLSD